MFIDHGSTKSLVAPLSFGMYERRKGRRKWGFFQREEEGIENGCCSECSSKCRSKGEGRVEEQEQGACRGKKEEVATNR